MDQTVSHKSTAIRLPFDYYTLRLFIIALVIFGLVLMTLASLRIRKRLD